ncbi:hypothetical protein [Streptomyces sp. NPDC054804]
MLRSTVPHRTPGALSRLALDLGIASFAPEAMADAPEVPAVPPLRDRR